MTEYEKKRTEALEILRRLHGFDDEKLDSLTDEKIERILFGDCKMLGLLSNYFYWRNGK